MAGKYNFITLDASQNPELIFRRLQRHISGLFAEPRPRLRQKKESAQ